MIGGFDGISNGGSTADILYVGRSVNKGAPKFAGRVHAKKEILYVAKNSAEQLERNYEVLVVGKH